MDEKDIQNKINAVLELVRTQKEATRKAFARTTLIYVLLTLFVVGYTSYIYFQATTLITPATVSQMLVNSANAHLPALRAEFRSQMKPFAERVADQSIDNIKKAIPNCSAYAKNLIKSQVDEVLVEFETKNLPAIQQHLDESMESILADKEKLKGSNVGDLLANEVVTSTEIELDKILTKDFYKAVADLKATLDELHQKPTKKMTRQEHAEVLVIASWIRLNETAKLGEDSGFITALSAFSNQAVSAVAESLSNSADKSMQKK